MDRHSRSRSRSRSPSRSDSYRRRRSHSHSRSRSRSRSPRHRRDSSGRRRDQDRNYRSGPQDGFLDKRKTQREEAMPSRAVWARSPPRPVDEDEESCSDSNSANRRMHRKEGKKDKRKHKDKKRRDKKEKRDKKDKKDKRDKRKSKKRKRSRSRDSNDRDRKRQRKERESSSSESENSEEQVWTEKKVVPAVVNTTEEEDFGPTPLHQVGAVQKYGGQMLPGEAEAYAQYVQQNKRIPRRGEVGMSNEQIDNMENLGYVMSGNRNKRMTAVRIRKENQVLTAEEKRQLVQTTLEEKAKKENKIIADMRELVAQKFKQQQQ